MYEYDDMLHSSLVKTSPSWRFGLSLVAGIRYIIYIIYKNKSLKLVNPSTFYRCIYCLCASKSNCRESSSFRRYGLVFEALASLLE
jgi:hypothetical protein